MNVIRSRTKWLLNWSQNTGMLNTEPFAKLFLWPLQIWYTFVTEKVNFDDCYTLTFGFYLAEAVVRLPMSCAMIATQVGIFLNSIEMMEVVRCGRRKQRNPRRKNGEYSLDFTELSFKITSFMVKSVNLSIFGEITRSTWDLRGPFTYDHLICFPSYIGWWSWKSGVLAGNVIII